MNKVGNTKMDIEDYEEMSKEKVELVPLSKILKLIKYATDSKFSKDSVSGIQLSISHFISELAKESEKHARIRTKKHSKNISVTIQKEDIIAALQRGGNKYHFINSSMEFLDDNNWMGMPKENSDDEENIEIDLLSSGNDNAQTKLSNKSNDKLNMSGQRCLI
ncbi:hypothetical protein cand_011060 [Cryptosporidium andersoni]|uniref:Transcription factor CBF/NF-Y/archaeal histone domain-containing protein n=1 Tax=Cryptosporidium andersoni TaxID=117008 RepID=A0A1J4MTK6_9CRYT|nr:hypothetical protein cand_011060 [Cryptosporidium andersoni]